jgi:putative SOS response-associated peptidase YedK
LIVAQHAAKPSPRSRCFAPPSNALVALFQRGYYEWRTINGAKQPYYFSASGVLSIAGLWDEWNDITSGEPLLSCTMIVTEANKFAGRVHDRMPVFLAGDSFETWLDGSAGVELLCSAPENLLRVWPVSARVNRSGTGGDDPTLIDRIAS